MGEFLFFLEELLAGGGPFVRRDNFVIGHGMVPYLVGDVVKFDGGRRRRASAIGWKIYSDRQPVERA